MKADLFSQSLSEQGPSKIQQSSINEPLASRMRPNKLEDFAGQSHLLEEGKPLQQALSQGHLHSMILWGPSGVGKTTLARMMANYTDAEFVSISAVLAGVKDIRHSYASGRAETTSPANAVLYYLSTRVHRFNKSQQDAFLPYIEQGHRHLCWCYHRKPII